MTGGPAKRKGRLFVVTAPSGAGKTSLIDAVMRDDPSLKISVSYTTRAPRPGEKEGVDYHFVDVPTFGAMRSRGEFLESAEVHGNHYGTAKRVILDAVAKGEDMILEIDWQGADQVAAKAPNDAVRVFILPPSMHELARRLHARAQDSQKVIEGRLERAYGEIAQWRAYDYVIVNVDYDHAYADLAHIYHAERLKRDRQTWAEPFVEQLLAEKV
jgi:guanylate kinase